MPTEGATHISELNSGLPTGSGSKSDGDDELRQLKLVLKNDFPNINGAVTVTPAEANSLTGSTAVQAVTVDTTFVAGDFNFLPALTKVTAPADGVPVILTLPAMSGVSAGKRRKFYNNSSGNVQLDPSGTDTIGGMNANYRIPSFSLVEITSDGTSAALLTLAPFRFIGEVTELGVASAPPGFVACVGAALSRTGYAGLFNVIGTTFGVGDGSTTFNLPNYARKTAVGSGGTGTGTLGNAVGNTGGAETHVLVTGELPPLFCGLNESLQWETNTGSFHNYLTPGADNYAVKPVGTSTPHNNLQPSLVMAFFVKT